MAVSIDPAVAKPADTLPTMLEPTAAKPHSRSKSMDFKALLKRSKDSPPQQSIDTPTADAKQPSVGSSISSEEDLNTNNDLPTLDTLRSIENLPLLDQDGRSVPFKTLYTGPNVARRVLVIFIRHFFCGYCQEYIRSLTSSVSPSALLQLPTPTFIAIIGHGSPSLIPMYQAETNCPFPIYADPTKKIYNALGMMRTHSSGARPEYQRKEVWNIMAASFVQSIKRVKGGLLLKGGDYQQVGGEFLFEPTNVGTPLCTPGEMEEKQLGVQGMLGNEEAEEKVVTWCHRMRNTRDHAEIPEVREVLGLNGEGVGGQDQRRWEDAKTKRKGTGFSEFSAKSKLDPEGEDGSSGGSIVSRP